MARLFLQWFLSAGASSLMPIHTSNSAPASFKNGSFSSVMANMISTTRSTMAPAVP